VKKSEMILQLQNEFKLFKDENVAQSYELNVPIEPDIDFSKILEELKDKLPLLYWLIKTDPEIEENIVQGIIEQEMSLFILDPLGIKNSLSNIEEKIKKNIIKNLILLCVTSVPLNEKSLEVVFRIGTHEEAEKILKRMENGVDELV
jgi:hypothetical protein